MRRSHRLGLLAAVGALILAGDVSAYTVSIADDISVERWLEGAATPLPGDASPWYDVIAGETFRTRKAEVTWIGTSVLLSLFTRFPEGGSGAHGSVPAGEPLYKLADVAIDLNRDGVWEWGIALSTHSGPGPSQDPASWRDPPGTALPADSFERGGVYSIASNDDWFWANDIHMYNSTLGGRYDEADPKATLVWMRLGNKERDATLTWSEWTEAPGFWRLDVFLDDVNVGGLWNDFVFLWGTATCGNDVIVGRAAVPEPGTLLLVGSGLACIGGAVRRRRAKGSGDP